MVGFGSTQKFLEFKSSFWVGDQGCGKNRGPGMNVKEDSISG